MNKPLKDWTLGEAQDYVYDLSCDNCKFQKRGDVCRLCRCPGNWDLSEPPRWTEQEREDAMKLLTTLDCDYTNVSKSLKGIVCVSGSSVNSIRLRRDAFPSIEPGETVKLVEIAGCEE